MRDVCARETIVGEFICDQLADCYAAGVNNDIACELCCFASGELTRRRCEYWKTSQEKQCTCTANATAAPVDTSNLPELPSSSLKDCFNLIETSAVKKVAPFGVVGILIAMAALMR